MSLCFDGRDGQIAPNTVNIQVTSDNALIRLGQKIPWGSVMDLVTTDLKKTRQGLWHLGRRLHIRLHVSVFLLQIIFDLTDRATEERVRYGADFQIFTGKGLLEHWHVPDRTKIQNFRSRLSPETQRSIANLISVLAVNLGFADPRNVDLDSTVQEANAAYPSDVSLMQKLAEKCKKVVDWLKSSRITEHLSVDIAKIKSAAKGYFFLAKNTATEIRQTAFSAFHKLVKRETHEVIKWLEEHSTEVLQYAKYNIADAIMQISSKGRRYLLDVAHFVRTHSVKSGKILSLHLENIKCIIKNKAGKKYEFGRVFQLARIGGNFAFVGEGRDLLMSDKTAVLPIIRLHSKLFGDGVLQSFTGDKGYYSTVNTEALTAAQVEDFHLGYEYQDQSQEDYRRLYGRRAGMEPIIGHIKQGGQLAKSRMKSDCATLAAGYASVCGFNLRQLMKSVA